MTNSDVLSGNLDLSSLKSLCYAAMMISSLGITAVLGVAIYVIVRLRTRANMHLRNMTDSMPKSLNCLRYAQIPAKTLALFCIHKGTPLDQVIEGYQKDSFERKAIIRRTFGQSDFVQRFIEKSQFYHKGYAGEEELLELVKR